MKAIRKRHNEGQIFVWAVLVLAVAAVLSVGVVNGITTALRSTSQQFDARQAYFTAKSAASATAEYLIKNNGDADLVQRLIQNPGSGNLSGMGSYTVRVSYAASARIRVKATAVCGQSSRTVTAYLVKQPGGYASVAPTDYAAFVDGNAGGSIGKITGRLFAHGDLKLLNGESVTGDVAATGSVEVGSGSGTVIGGNLYCLGNAVLRNGGQIGKDVFAKGNVEISGGFIVNGNVTADGTLTCSSTIGGKATVGGQVSLGWGAAVAQLQYTTTPLNLPADISRFVTGQTVGPVSYTPLDLSAYAFSSLPVISPPSRGESPLLYQPVLIQNKVISESGTLDSAAINTIRGLLTGESLIIDASQKDIYLLLDNTYMNLDNGQAFKILVRGNHRAIIYLTGNSTVNIGPNVHLRGENPDLPTQLFFIGDGAQTIQAYNSSDAPNFWLDACVYLPLGTFAANGGKGTLRGSYISRNFSVGGQRPLEYKAADLTGTPLDIFLGGSGSAGPGSASSAGEWKIESWGTE